MRPGGTSQFVMSDDPRNEYGVPRELGAVLIRGAQLRVNAHQNLRLQLGNISVYSLQSSSVCWGGTLSC